MTLLIKQRHLALKQVMENSDLYGMKIFFQVEFDSPTSTPSPKGSGHLDQGFIIAKLPDEKFTPLIHSQLYTCLICQVYSYEPIVHSCLY